VKRLCVLHFADPLLHDAELDPYYILHYTYGDDYNLEGAFTPGKVCSQPPAPLSNPGLQDVR
jgi:hypothetical protein